MAETQVTKPLPEPFEPELVRLEIALMDLKEVKNEIDLARRWEGNEMKFNTLKTWFDTLSSRIYDIEKVISDIKSKLNPENE